MLASVAERLLPDMLNRSKPPLAIVTMCFNEADFLPIWLRYYSRQVPLEHLYVIDHGSTDGSTSGLAGINVIRLDPSPLDEVWRAGLVSEICGGLLSRYESVAYTDIDEILAADPRHYINLVDFCRRAEHEVTTALGLHVAHLEAEEPELAPMGPILQQRRYVLPVGSMSKPTLTRHPVNWYPGFHYINAPSWLSSLFLFHLAYCDIPIVRRRQAKRNGVTITGDFGGHHAASESALVAHLKGWSDLPRTQPVDLGQDCPIRAGFIDKLFATRSAGNSDEQIDATVSGGPGLWEIPERFRNIL